MSTIRRAALFAAALAVTVGGATAVAAASTSTPGGGVDSPSTAKAALCERMADVLAASAADVRLLGNPVTAKVTCSAATQSAPGGGAGAAATASAGAQVCAFGACSGTSNPVTVGTTGAGAQPGQVSSTGPSFGATLVPSIPVIGDRQVCIGTFCAPPVSTPPVRAVDSSTTVFSADSLTTVAVNGTAVVVRGPKTCVATGSQVCSTGGTGTDTAAGGFRTDVTRSVEVR
jgi:hypothetical protein